ncbi:hypothetical protein EWM64_g2996 [Hericium alpestre]|uniref:Uncharacterized protein n=1 Tax=Hericium alpestre TaxID=135208 RepID=A0A4Z0A3V5_9AGAM|nr:hypothetical protein EWM64_g2996 [Hericium alpestre]
MSSPPPELVFSNSVQNMDDWARRTGIPLTTADALGTNYARAHRWLLRLKSTLVQQHGWREIHPPDSRMLFSIECPNPQLAGIARSPTLRLHIPANASSFFSPDRRVQWEMIFHSAVFFYMRHTVPPISDLLHLLQCLLTGLVVLVKEEHVPGDGCLRTIRGLPPMEWVTSHEQMLKTIVSPTHYRALYRAAGDPRVAFKLERG